MPASTRRLWASATTRRLENAGWHLANLDLIEANEAFAAQALSVGKELGWDMPRSMLTEAPWPLATDRRFGLPRAGDPVARDDQTRRQKKGLATLCTSGGQGVALAIER
ncbi:hypothetical protein JNA64_03710 [Pseudomonas stutzeri]|nr:hypothetical protein [Stutzerimonas stutzeri]